MPRGEARRPLHSLSWVKQGELAPRHQDEFLGLSPKRWDTWILPPSIVEIPEHPAPADSAFSAWIGWGSGGRALTRRR